MNGSEKIKQARGTRWCKTGIGLVLIGLALAIIGLVGGRFEWLSPIVSFLCFGAGFLFLATAGLVSAIGIAISMGTAGDASAPRSWGALAISVIFIGAALSQRPDSSGAPPIHDITTDTVTPPLFEAILPLRADAPNPPGYSGAQIAGSQLAAYPDLETLSVARPTGEVFAAAVQVAGDLGWEIVSADHAAGRIEATDTTTWFHFKDDVVVRLAADSDGSIVDVRSKSRVGRSDLGANAHRIRLFLSQLKAKLGDQAGTPTDRE